MRTIERANPDTLTRVFGATDWGNREMLGDELLKDLIEGLSGVPLGNTAVESDILGDAYEYLIGKFADITRRKKAGEFYTPRSVVRMMVELLDPQEGESIYDPACGTGGMLLGAIEDVEDRAKVVSNEEIEREDWTLNISRYVLPPIGEDIPPLPEAVAAFKQALAEARAAEDRLRRVLVEDGWLE